MNYKQIDSIMHEFESYLMIGGATKHSLLAYQINPIKAAMQLLESLTKIEEQQSVMELRSSFLKQTIIDQTKAILENLYEPTVINYCVRQTDINQEKVITYMERHDCYELMETKVMDRVIMQMWDGSID